MHVRAHVPVRICMNIHMHMHNFIEKSRSHGIFQGMGNRVCVLVHLFYMWLLKVQELRMSYESQSILMTEFNVCPVCKKRFGNLRYEFACSLVQNILFKFWSNCMSSP
jgi:hypothetical protein